MMSLFRKKKKTLPKFVFDSDRQTAVIRCSICHGEQVAGFKDKDTGTFHEVMLIQGEADLQLFQETYGVSEVRKEY